MANEKIKRATKEALISRAQANRDKKKEYKEYYCKAIDANLLIKKLSITRVCEIMDMADDSTLAGDLELSKQLIYESVPLLQDKEIQDAYGCAEPYDIVLAVMDDDIGELQRVSQTILSIYGLDELDLETEIKN